MKSKLSARRPELQRRNNVVCIAIKQATKANEIAAIKTLRTSVFIDEQGVSPDLESDDLDLDAYHAIASMKESTVGTGRLVSREDGSALIGRMAVEISHRRCGVGRRILLFLESYAVEIGASEITVHSQSHAVGFYMKNGYSVEGDPFEEAGIQHVIMRKPLP